MSLTRGPAGNRATTGTLLGTQECRDTNCTTRTTSHYQTTVLHRPNFHLADGRLCFCLLLCGLLFRLVPCFVVAFVFFFAFCVVCCFYHSGIVMAVYWSSFSTASFWPIFSPRWINSNALISGTCNMQCSVLIDLAKAKR